MQPLSFFEAIAWARERGVVLPDVYYGELQGLARSMAFSVAGLSKLDQLQAIMDSLADATANGESFAEWVKQATDPNGPISLDLPPHRVENIFRTNIQSHYARGRCEQQKRTADDFPYLLYDAVNDSRTRPAHAAMDGFVARRDDPIWQTWRPPRGYQCRCRVIALSERQAGKYLAADRRRLEDPDRAQARRLAVTGGPDAGWDYDICAEPTEGLRRAIAQKGAKANPALFSAFQALQRMIADHIMNIVEFAGFDSVRDALALVALRQPQWFPDGIQGVHAVSNEEFFAALDQGTLYVSTAEWPELNFAPARELVDALANIKAGRPLSFNQEYAVEVLQHELVHSAYPRATPARRAIDIEDFEECLVQLVARQRYPELLKRLGAEARYAQAILNNGYAYHRGTRNLAEIAQQAGIGVDQLEQSLRAPDARSAIKQLIAKSLGVSVKQASGLLNHAMIKPLDDFRAKIAQLQAYARPPGRE